LILLVRVNKLPSTTPMLQETQPLTKLSPRQDHPLVKMGRGKLGEGIPLSRNGDC
jgi:hypothetical protein